MEVAVFTLLLCIGVLAGCSDGSDRLPQTPPTITTLSIEPPIAILDIDSSERYQALATYSDGLVKDVTGLADWSLEFDTGVVEPASDPGDPGGFLVRAVMAGEDTILATLEGVSANSPVSVVESELVRLDIIPQEADLLVDSSLSFRALGTYADGHTQDLTDEGEWTSANKAFVTVDGSGVATAVAEGTTSISVELDELFDPALVVVHEEVDLESIEVLPQDVGLFVDGSQQFNAWAHYSDGSMQQVTKSALWISSDTSVVAQDVNRKGLFHALSVGSAEITAELGLGNEGSTTVTVEEVVLTHIVVTPRDFSLSVGDSKRYFTEAVTSDGGFYSLNQSPMQSYSVGDPSVAYISNNPENKGLLTGLSPGSTTVVSTFEYEGETYTDQATLTVCTVGDC
jgi:hypothetical protein